MNNELKNSIKSTRHVQKKQLSFEKGLYNKDYSHTKDHSHTVLENGKIAEQAPKADHMILKFQNQVYRIIDRITKPSFKRPEVSESEIASPRFKATRWPIQFIPNRRVKIPVKPQHSFQFQQPVSKIFNNYF